MRRNAARGVHAVCFSEIPPKLGLPSIHSGEWDPFFAACQETNTVVCMHIGSSSQMPATSGDAPVAVAATLSFNNAMASLSDFLFSGVLVRFPTLKLAYSEGQIGWLPYVLERADDVWREHRAWGGVKDLVPEPPSTYYYRQVYGCFFRDRHGLESLDRVGVDNITFETDYPHTDSTWPDTKEVAEDLMGHLPDDVDLQDHARQRDPHARRSTSTELSSSERRRGAGTVERRGGSRSTVVVDARVAARRTTCGPRPRSVSRSPGLQLVASACAHVVRRRGIVGGADARRSAARPARGSAPTLPCGGTGQNVHGRPSHTVDAPKCGAACGACRELLHGRDRRSAARARRGNRSRRTPRSRSSTSPPVCAPGVRVGEREHRRRRCRGRACASAAARVS